MFVGATILIVKIRPPQGKKKFLLPAVLEAAYGAGPFCLGLSVDGHKKGTVVRQPDEDVRHSAAPFGRGLIPNRITAPVPVCQEKRLDDLQR